VKYSVLISNHQEVQELLNKSINIAKKGPLVRSHRYSTQYSRSNIDPSPQFINKFNSNDTVIPDENLINQIKTLIEFSSRPIILAGGGVRSSKATEELYDFAHTNGIPVVVSLMGLDSFPHNDQLYIGMIGTYGNRYANLTIANSDLIIALGTRFDTRQTGTKPETFARSAKIIHVDIDPHELNNKIMVDLPLNMDIKKFLRYLNMNSFKIPKKYYSSWYEQIQKYKSNFSINTDSKNDQISPYDFLREVSNALPEDAIICVDVVRIRCGQLKQLRLKRIKDLLLKGDASIGSAVPLAIGASFAKPYQMIIIITGDGGFQLNIQELQTIYYHKLPLKLFSE
jgi:acetolactate synthase-1/2/3 large subunit